MTSTNEGSYDWVLVALSVVIAIMAAYAALDFARRVTFARGKARFLWVTGGAIAMGFGIWSMHYIGMLALRLPMPVQYDWPTVLLSLLAAITASAVALVIVSRPKMGWGHALLGSQVMGSGIATMHYTGMAAMRMPAMCSYSLPLVAVSVILAVVISLAALWLTRRSRRDRASWRKSVSAIIMGLAIPVMHYTGMAAAQFTSDPSMHEDISHAVSVSSLSVAGIGLVTFIVLGAVLLTNLRFESLPTARQLAVRYFLSLAVICVLAILGALLVEHQGNQAQASIATETSVRVGPHAAASDTEQSGHELQMALLLSVLGVLVVQGLVLLRPALVNIQQGMSDLEHAKQALQHKTEELARSNAELEQFAYVASHDLQEPLRMVASYTQLLSRRYRGKLDTDADEFIGFAVDGATRMQTLIRDLLSYSRVTTQGRAPKPTDAALACRTACRSLQKAIEDSRATVTIGSLPTILADETQLAQVFQNLIGNAIKYRAKERQSQIHVEAQPLTDAWRFSVQDNGIGMEPQYFERIFQMFQRLHTREQYPGTGIGLAICRRIVERHGGKIWVESSPGIGSTFYFTIPKI